MTCLVTTAEVARRLRVTVRSVQRYRHHGLPAPVGKGDIEQGHTNLYDWSEVRAWAERTSLFDPVVEVGTPRHRISQASPVLSGVRYLTSRDLEVSIGLAHGSLTDLRHRNPSLPWATHRRGSAWAWSAEEARALRNWLNERRLQSATD